MGGLVLKFQILNKIIFTAQLKLFTNDTLKDIVELIKESYDISPVCLNPIKHCIVLLLRLTDGKYPSV